MKTILVTGGAGFIWVSGSFGFRAGDFPIAEKIGDASLSLPFYPNMPLEQVDVVVGPPALALERGGRF
jgi:dTDP-4-amino-4,6-dideoxygalactose transaminase